MPPHGASPIAMVILLGCAVLAGCVQETLEGRTPGPRDVVTSGTIRTMAPNAPVDPEPAPGPVPPSRFFLLPDDRAWSDGTDVRLDAQAGISDGLVLVTVTAHNLRDAPLRHLGGYCGTPWGDVLQGPAGPVQRRTVDVACGQVEHEELPAGHAVSATWAWNATHATAPHDGQDTRWEPADAGDHAWRFTFRFGACDQPDACAESVEVVARFTVRATA